MVLDIEHIPMFFLLNELFRITEFMSELISFSLGLLLVESVSVVSLYSAYLWNYIPALTLINSGFGLLVVRLSQCFF